MQSTILFLFCDCLLLQSHKNLWIYFYYLTIKYYNYNQMICRFWKYFTRRLIASFQMTFEKIMYFWVYVCVWKIFMLFFFFQGVVSDCWYNNTPITKSTTLYNTRTCYYKATKTCNVEENYIHAVIDIYKILSHVYHTTRITCKIYISNSFMIFKVIYKTFNICYIANSFYIMHYEMIAT